MRKWFGAFVAFAATELSFHMMEAAAAGLKADTAAERLGAVLFGVATLAALAAAFRKLCSPPFFHGFVVATGLFLSFDIVAFHWIFQLHRVTNGPEANWLEPLFVAAGVALLVYGYRKERRRA